MVRSATWASKSANAVLIGMLGLTALLCLAPIWHTLAVSLSDKSAAASGVVYLWPVEFTWSSYDKLLQDSKFFDAFLVSVERVALGGAFNFALTILTAYPLSKNPRQLPGRNVVTWVLVFAMLFNAGLIPWYMTISKLGLLDSIWALVLPGAVPIFNVILLLNFFRGIPRELEESAFVDGSGPWRTLLQIHVPIALPALATVTLFSLVGHWNSFFDGLILMNSPGNYPLQTYIQQLVVQLNTQSLMSAEDARRLAEISNKTLNAAKIFVSMIPILIIYPFLQRYFIHGIVLGSVKE